MSDFNGSSISDSVMPGAIVSGHCKFEQRRQAPLRANRWAKKLKAGMDWLSSFGMPVGVSRVQPEPTNE